MCALKIHWFCSEIPKGPFDLSLKLIYLLLSLANLQYKLFFFFRYEFHNLICVWFVTVFYFSISLWSHGSKHLEADFITGHIISWNSWNVVTPSPKKQFYVTFRGNVAFEDFLQKNKKNRFVTDPFFWMHFLTRM